MAGKRRRAGEGDGRPAKRQKVARQPRDAVPDAATAPSRPAAKAAVRAKAKGKTQKAPAAAAGQAAEPPAVGRLSQLVAAARSAGAPAAAPAAKKKARQTAYAGEEAAPKKKKRPAIAAAIAPPSWLYKPGFVVDAFANALDQRLITKTLLDDCKSVYKKCSYWMPADAAPRCVFEKFALDVFQAHFERTGLKAVPAGSGAEWWVQVRGSSAAQGGNSLGFHWDRDEELAVDRGVVVCPAFGTVTYLCDVGAPTVMIGIPPSAQRGARKITDMYVSHPQRGKHVVFRGDALHGCPEEFMNKASQAAVCAKYTRTTLLVNLWVGFKPSKIAPLPGDLVPALKTPASLALYTPRPAAPVPHVPPGSSCPVVGFQFGRKKAEDHELWLPTPTKKAAVHGTFALSPCPPKSKCVRISG